MFGKGTNSFRVRVIISVALTAVIFGCEPDDPVMVDDALVMAAKGGGNGPPKVNEAIPPSGEQETTLDVRVLGSGFDHGSVATFTLNGTPTPKVKTNSTVFIGGTELLANVTISADAEIDLYDVEVMTARGKKGIGADLFRVVAKGFGGPYELITFTGDLAGEELVAGCCPNAGPFPAYTMTLSETFPLEISGEHTGNIFMNSFHPRMPWDYKVQFWWEEEPGDEYFIEIRGGDSSYDKKTKILTVTFDQEEMTIIHPVGDSTYVDVSFVLTRAPIG